MSTFLHHLSEAVGNGEGGVNEALNAVLQAGLCPVVQLWAWAVHTLVPADISESVYLKQNKKNNNKSSQLRTQLIKLMDFWNATIFILKFYNWVIKGN